MKNLWETMDQKMVENYVTLSDFNENFIFLLCLMSSRFVISVTSYHFFSPIKTSKQYQRGNTFSNLTNKHYCQIAKIKHWSNCQGKFQDLEFKIVIIRYAHNYR